MPSNQFLDMRKDKVTLSEEREEGHSDRPRSPRFLLVIAGMLGGAVTAAEVVWPGAASAIHDGLMAVGMFILSARRR